MSKVWVYAEPSPGGGVNSTALELCSRAKELGEAEAVALGPGATEAAALLGRHGIQTVYASDDSVFTDYVAEPAVHALTALIAEHRPSMILFGSDYESRDVAARLAAVTGSTVMSNANEVRSLTEASTQILGGTQITDVTLDGPDPKIVLVRPKSYTASETGGTATVVEVTSDVPSTAKRSKRVQRHAEEAPGPKLEDAKVVICGGRGLVEASNFKYLDELATLLGGAVGATRAVVDAGWVPYSYQVGQTGKTVKPDVYIAVGISGASQHLVGMKESRHIISINRDAEAPISGISNLSVAGDSLKILPKLIEAIRARRG